MQGVLTELTRSGVVDPETAAWVRAQQGERGGALDTVLLELRAIEEPALLEALSEHFAIPASSLAELSDLDPELAERVSPSLSDEYSMCPIRFHDYGVLVWVATPLSIFQLDALRGLVGLEIHQRIAPAHHLAAARERLYGVAGDERLEALRSLLERPRPARDVPAAIEAIEAAADLSGAASAVADFISQRLEVACFLVASEDGLRVLGARGPCAPDGSWLAIPEGECEFGPALRYGGYFLGEVADREVNVRFFASLRREIARWVFVAPLPTPGGPAVVFFGENGSSAISTRCAAEVSLVLARLAQRGGEWESLVVDGDVRPFGSPLSRPVVAAESSPADAEDVSTDSARPTHGASTSSAAGALASSTETVLASPAALSPPDAGCVESAGAPAMAVIAPVTAPTISDEELLVLDRLRDAASAASMDLGSFVEALLAPTPPKASAEPPAAALAGDVKDLFEKLATDIPAQLARGMEAAFRDLAPRIGGAPAAAPAVAAAPRPSAAASVDLVVKEAGPREVPSYRSRRRKSKRVKL